MRISVLNATPVPIKTISAAAATCYDVDVSVNTLKRVTNCYKRGHLSVFEHVSVTFLVTGISRACSHQLVRHRLASYSQQSQRYCRIDVDDHDWYVMPPKYLEAPYEDNDAIGMPLDNFFTLCMFNAANNYNEALAAGVKPEDARYLLPEATKTEIVVTMNLRELYHFLELRDSKSAQWEIREVSRGMREALSRLSNEWEFLLELQSKAVDDDGA